MTELRISPDLALPVDAATQTFALLAMRGAGKSTAAVDLAEEMTKAGIHWIAIDPKGDWWGIRASIDGKGPGLSVPIFGGKRGDTGLTPASGPLVAELLVREGISAVLDVSEFTKGDQIRFLGGHGNEDGFFGRLYRLKDIEQPPTHLFLEEAHEYLPQSIGKGDSGMAKLHYEASRISTMGRNRGLGATLVSQRSARVHKDVLTQTDTLIAMRNTSPQDRKAVKDWVDYHDASQEIVDSLPTLDDGEAWVVSPQKLKVVQRIRFRHRETFDSGATPTVVVRGQRRAPTLADIDFPAINAAMKATEEELKEKDPRELRRQIAALQRDLKAAQAQAARAGQEAKVETVVETVEVPVIDPALVQKLSDVVVTGMDRLDEMTGRLEKEIEAALDPIAIIADELELRIGKVPDPVPISRPQMREQNRNRQTEPSAKRPSPPPPRREKAADNIGGEVTRAQQRILNALAWMESVGIAPANRTQLALMADASPASSGYANNLGAMRTAGFIDYPAGGMVGLTEAGRSLAEVAEAPFTSEELQAAVIGKIGGAKGRILQALVDAYPDSLSRDELAERVGASAISSGYANNLGSLRSLGLLDYPSKGYVAALPVLFLEG